MNWDEYAESLERDDAELLRQAAIARILRELPTATA